MFSELLMKGMPHDEAGDDYKAFLKMTLELEVLKVVHFQLNTNTKVVLLRTKSEDVGRFEGRKIQYRQWIISLEKHLRPIVKAINTIEKLSSQMQEKGEPRLKLQKLAKVNLSNISNGTKMEDLQEEMGKFGEISKIEIFEKGEMKNKKRLKCRLAVIHYDNIDGAIEAFFNDKIVINGVSSKVKLYLTPKKLNSFLKKKKLMSHNSTQSGGNSKEKSATIQEPERKRPHPSYQTRKDTATTNFHHFYRGNDHGFQASHPMEPDYQGGARPPAYHGHLEPYYRRFQQEVSKRMSKTRNGASPTGRKLKLRQDLEIEDITRIQNPHNLRFNKGENGRQVNHCRDLDAHYYTPYVRYF